MHFITEKIIDAFSKGVFPYVDGFRIEKEPDQETDEETDEETDTTNMPELESEESAKQRRNQRQEKD